MTRFYEATYEKEDFWETLWLFVLIEYLKGDMQGKMEEYSFQKGYSISDSWTFAVNQLEATQATSGVDVPIIWTLDALKVLHKHFF